jgi:ATP adenylyltransferase
LVYVEDAKQPDSTNCPFCEGPNRDDDTSLIIARGNLTFAVLNLYPYNSGHILICPYRHFSSLLEASPAELQELTDFTRKAMTVLAGTLGAQGFNIGINQGVVAGAGIAAHLHQHVVPRWANDANFMPIVAKTKTMPRLLGELRQQLADAWPQA